jgi:hypothetical protein
MDRIAAQRGDGLRPDLRAALEKAALAQRQPILITPVQSEHSQIAATVREKHVVPGE